MLIPSPSWRLLWFFLIGWWCLFVYQERAWGYVTSSNLASSWSVEAGESCHLWLPRWEYKRDTHSTVSEYAGSLQCSPGLWSFSVQATSSSPLLPFAAVKTFDDEMTTSSSWESSQSALFFSSTTSAFWKPLLLKVFLPNEGDSLSVVKGGKKFLSDAQPLPRPDRIAEKWLRLFSFGSSPHLLSFRQSSQANSGSLSQTVSAESCHQAPSLFFSQEKDPSCPAMWSNFSTYFQAPFGNAYAVDNAHLFSLIPLSARAPQPGEVVMTEIAWQGSFDGTTHNTTDQWIELYNTTDVPLQLVGLKFVGRSLRTAPLRIDFGAVLGPHDFFLVGKEKGERTLLEHNPDWGFDSLALSALESEIFLQSSTGITLDSTPSGSWPVPPLSGNFVSTLQRISPLVNGNSWSNWEYCPTDERSLCRQIPGKYWRVPAGFTLGTPWQRTLL